MVLTQKSELKQDNGTMLVSFQSLFLQKQQKNQPAITNLREKGYFGLKFQ